MAQALASAVPISERRRSVDYTGCAQWSYLFVCPAELEAEGDRLTAAHTEWMKATHPREGNRALLFRLVTKGPHPSSPDAVVFALTEVYQSLAGLDDHFRRVHEEWEEFPAWQALVDKCEGPWWVTGEIEHSLW
jgi:hypothetical protein